MHLHLHTRTCTSITFDAVDFLCQSQDFTHIFGLLLRFSDSSNRWYCFSDSMYCVTFRAKSFRCRNLRSKTSGTFWGRGLQGAQSGSVISPQLGQRPPGRQAVVEATRGEGVELQRYPYPCIFQLLGLIGNKMKLFLIVSARVEICGYSGTMAPPTHPDLGQGLEQNMATLKILNPPHGLMTCREPCDCVCCQMHPILTTIMYATTNVCAKLFGASRRVKYP